MGHVLWRASGTGGPVPRHPGVHAAAGGNDAKLFDRVDAQPTPYHSVHLNLFLAHTWFQVPNIWDQQHAGHDQRQQIRTYNIAPGWVHLFGAITSLSVNPFFRQDRVQYYPSGDPENPDTNPPRVAPRHLFDLAVGTDNLFHTEHPRWTLRLSALNLTDKAALYNFLSTFSGTHFVPPRTWQAELGIVF